MESPGDARQRLRQMLMLGLLLLPAAVLSIVTWRLIVQERELESSRLEERRALVTARIAQRMLSRLERERATAPTAVTEAVVPRDENVLVLVAPATARGMMLPWEAAEPPAGGGAFDAAISEAEALEFARGRPDLAAARYAAIAAAATSPALRLEVRLREARVLSRAGRADAAVAAYSDLIAAPAKLRDRDGMPLALYGAEGLLSSTGREIGAVLDALESMASAPALGPPALYALRDLAARTAAAVRTSAAGAADAPGAGTVAADRGAKRSLERAAALEKSVRARIRVAERLVELRRDLPAVLALAGSSGAEPALPDTTAAGSEPAARAATSAWRPWGPEPWLVGVADDGDRRLVLVVDPARLLRALATEAGNDLAEILTRVSLTTVPRADAELLGPGFPGLLATLPDDALPPATSSGFGRVLLAGVLPLVLCVLGLAAFLLWRDVRRELRITALRAQFVSSVSHELKTPLTSIRMYAQTLLLGRHRTESDRRSYLETIVNESERLTRLIDNVLDFSRIERGGRTYRMAPASLESVVRSAARAMSYPLEQGAFDLRLQIDPALPAVSIDADALTQAVVNLLANAVKFSGDSRLIELRLSRGDGEAVISVRDHGRGIDKRHQRAVFERFFRAPEAESEGIPGTGLGLALVAHVAAGHGGRVELESAPDRGSTFAIRLPLDRSASAPAAPASVRAPADPAEPAAMDPTMNWKEDVSA